MEPVESKQGSFRTFVSRHKVAIAVVATSAFWIAINRRNKRQYDEVLGEYNLLDKNY